MMPLSDYSLVYSTAHGSICPECGNSESSCVCGKPQTNRSGDGIIRVSRETKGRKGKGVTVITGLNLDDLKLDALARDLKRKCGAGGTVKQNIINPPAGAPAEPLRKAISYQLLDGDSIPLLRKP